MKVTELRIGNLVNYEQTTHVITDLSNTGEVSTLWIKDTKKEYYFSHETQIKPIEIDKDILLRFGFQVIYESDFRTKYEHLEHTEIEFQVIKARKSFLFCGHHFKVEYVHQLQNMFRCLTEKELIYNIQE